MKMFYLSRFGFSLKEYNVKGDVLRNLSYYYYGSDFTISLLVYKNGEGYIFETRCYKSGNSDIRMKYVPYPENVQAVVDSWLMRIAKEYNVKKKE
jgi:hypothetical protein